MDEASGITAGSAENPLIRLESKFVSGQRLEQILRDWDNIQSAESIHHDQRRSLKLGSFRAKMRGSQVKAMLSDPIFARFAAAFVILKEVRFDSLIAFLNCGSKEEENMILRNIQKESHWRPKFERLFGLKRQNLNFACGIHLAADETPENILEYCKSNSEAIYQCAQMDPDFLSSLKSKIQHIAKFSQTIEARARILLEIVKQRANIDAAVLEKYSNACHEMNHFKLEFLRKELVKWRIIDSRSIEDMPFANLIDNVLCFLVYENDFPGSFTPPLCPISPEKSYSAIEEEKDDISSLNEEVLSNEEVAKAEMQTEPRESSPSYAYSPNVDIYGWMMSLIMSIAFFSLIYVSFISITNSVLQKNDNICRLSNTGLINSLNDFNFRTSALHRVLYNEVRNNYLKLDNSLESDRILAKVFLLSNASAIFLADSSGKFLGISKSEDGLVIRSIDHSQSSCLFEFSSRSIDLSLERDLSTPPRNLTCAFDPRSEVWYTAEAEYRPQWSKRYLISSGNHVNYALRGSFLKDSTTNTAIIMEYCVETLRSLVLDFENPHPSSSCILDPESLNLIVSSSELDSKTFSQLNVIPSESNDSNIRETFDQFVKFSDFNPYASSSSYSFSLKHISACSGVYQSENGLSLTVVNSFSLDLFFRNRNLATIGSSLAAVFAILLSIGMIFLSRTIRGLQQETLRKISSSINAVRASLRVTQASVYEFVSSLQNFAIRRKTSPNVVVQNDDGAEMTELSHSESNFSTNIKASEAHHSKPTTENSNYFTLPRLINYFYISLFLIFLLTFIVWYVWSTLASSNERPKSIAIVEENSHQIFLSLRRFVKNSEIAIQMMLARVSFGRLTFSPLDSLSSRDTFVMGLLDEFSLSGNYSQFSAAYFSQPNREFAGAAIYHDVEGINFISLAQDSSTGLCYSEFLTFDNFTRDSSSLEYEDCSYNALSLPWYQGAINSANMHWSDIYLVRGRESRLGVSLSSAIRSIEGSVKAVIGIDISLDKISDLLSHSEAKHFNDTSIIALLIEPDGTIVSNSLQVSYKDNRGKNETINAAEFNETSVADTWSFLTYGNQGITDVYSKLTAIERVFQDPLTYLVDISGNVSVLNWKLIVLGSWYVFLKSLYNNDEFSLMICFLIFAILELRKYHKRRDRFDQIARSKLSLVVAGKWYKRLYPQVNQAFINAWQSDSNLLSRPATLNFINQNRIVQSAIRYFDAKNGRDVPVACFMESQSTLILRMYKWINSPLSSLILRAVIFVHMLLAFAEPYSNQKLRSNPLRPAVIVFQLFCILYESFEAVIRTIVYYYALRVEDSVSTITWKFKVSIILDITMFLIFFDWLFKISISFSGEYYFPIKAIMILLFISELRRICGAFFRTILRTRDVFIFYLMVMFLSSATAHLLFKDNVYFSQVSTDTFATFFRSFITMFVYISTGENLTQVIFPAVRESGYGLYLVIILLFFIVATAIGQFFIMGLILSFFQDDFKVSMEATSRRRRLKSRLGVIASFILIDIDGSGLIDQREFEAFVNNVNPNMTKDQISLIFNRFNVHKENSHEAQLDMVEFVTGVEASSSVQLGRTTFQIERVPEYNSVFWRQFIKKYFGWSEKLSYFSSLKQFSRSKGKQESSGFGSRTLRAITSSFRSSRLRFSVSTMYKIRLYLMKILEHPHTKYLSKFLVILQAWTLALYGVYSNPSELNIYGILFLNVFFLELLLKLITYGAAFVNSSRYDWMDEKTRNLKSGDAVQEFSNRAELIIILISYFMFIISMIATGFDLNAFDRESWARIFIFPSLRIVLLLPTSRKLAFALYLITPQFLSLLFLLLTFCYIYAVYGVLLFRDSWRILQDESPSATFTGIGDAFLALFQMVVGEAWDSLMYASIKTKKSFFSIWYFISFVFMVTLLFTNVIIALIARVTSRIFSEKEVSSKSIDELIVDDGE